MKKQTCPCGSQLGFDTCCGLFINLKSVPSSPEQLMRSRYTAFYQKNADYLLNTLAAPQRQQTSTQSLQQSFSSSTWKGLRVINSYAGKDGQESFVEFVAFFEATESPGIIQQLHELSRFIQTSGKWFYVDGKMLPPIKLGRNDPCWCGSGKKLKKCHVTEKIL